MVEVVSTQRKKVIILASCGQPLPQDSASGLPPMAAAGAELSHARQHTPTGVSWSQPLAGWQVSWLAASPLSKPFPEKHNLQWTERLAPGMLSHTAYSCGDSPGLRPERPAPGSLFIPLCGGNHHRRCLIASPRRVNHPKDTVRRTCNTPIRNDAAQAQKNAALRRRPRS
ncbi:hypothetical protein Amal_03853 [Acetobacter malorum]|uniref:Uncharacterized protein n=1 Tax=Acetobacter malorum TaxID=178901 RepID=A0A177G6L2_9PROT|nr:hypothetical protein Amal_03853 [Acetobacter malorum]